MRKKKLYLDIDDTVLDTENYLRDVLGGKWKNYDGLIYEAYGLMGVDELLKVSGVLGNYESIPFIPGAEDGIKILSTEYDVVFCSSCFAEEEGESKKKWAKKLGLPIIICKGLTKGNIDMSGAVIVDDNTYNLDRTNASRKVCFYKKRNFFNLNGNELVFNWFDLVDKLCPAK